jgi:small basic protein
MPILAGPAARLSRNAFESFTMLEWVMLIVGSAACGLCAVWIAGLLGVPAVPGFNGSLLASSSPLLGVFIAIVAMVIGIFVGSFFTASVQSDAGFFCACLGLAGLAMRSGPIRPVLQFASSSTVFLKLSLETALLGAIVIATWYGFTKVFTGSMLLRPSAPAAPNELTDLPISKRLMASGVQILVMGALEYLLIQSDALAQGLVGVALAAYLSVLVTYMYMPMADGIWYWAGPSVLGVIGYLITYVSSDSLGTGEPLGLLPALSRTTPLAYVSAGTAGALLAHWCSRRWAQPEPSDQETAPA